MQAEFREDFEMAQTIKAFVETGADHVLERARTGGE